MDTEDPWAMKDPWASMLEEEMKTTDVQESAWPPWASMLEEQMKTTNVQASAWPSGLPRTCSENDMDSLEYWGSGSAR